MSSSPYGNCHISLKAGTMIWAMSKPTISDNEMVSNVSNRNWEIICPRAAPIALRTPTSFSLFAVMAIEVLVRLKHAMSKMINAIDVKMTRGSGLILWATQLLRTSF